MAPFSGATVKFRLPSPSPFPIRVYPCPSVAHAFSNLHRLEILKSRINRLLGKHPPLRLTELAHILLSKKRVGHALPLIVQKLGVNPRAFLRRRADPLPL